MSIVMDEKEMRALAAQLARNLCNVLGIKKDELLRYLVEHGVLF